MSEMAPSQPSFEAATPPEVHAWTAALLDDGPIDPALVAHVYAPAREVATRALRERDWANLGRYEAANAAADAAADAAPDIVFMGDSITEYWALADPGLFGPGRLCRGIAGQTAPQMLVRFQADVVDRRPRALHLLAGTNDIGGNTGPTTPRRYQDSLRAMVGLARAHGIAVMIGLIPPASIASWSRDLDRRPWIAALNTCIRMASTARCRPPMTTRRGRTDGRTCRVTGKPGAIPYNTRIVSTP